LIAILDYGSGNLRSAQRAFEISSSEVVVTSDPKICIEADGLVVPGVGAFAACMAQLASVGGKEIISSRIEKERAVFGICVGMQVLFEESDEKKMCSGLGILAGNVSEVRAPILPHMGWNTVKPSPESNLFRGIEEESFYFVHSYAAKKFVSGALNTTTFYGEEFLSAIERGYVVATQFHPEKSGAAGAKLIANWVSSL
jgi:imidazole glycerol-phosphate synthase subunit HisH